MLKFKSRLQLDKNIITFLINFVVAVDFYTRHRDWKTIHSCGIEDPSRCGNGVACCNTGNYDNCTTSYT